MGKGRFSWLLWNFHENTDHSSILTDAFITHLRGYTYDSSVDGFITLTQDEIKDYLETDLSATSEHATIIDNCAADDTAN